MWLLRDEDCSLKSKRCTFKCSFSSRLRTMPVVHKIFMAFMWRPHGDEVVNIKNPSSLCHFMDAIKILCSSGVSRLKFFAYPQKRQRVTLRCHRPE